jgi:hypothetical protein
VRVVLDCEQATEITGHRSTNTSDLAKQVDGLSVILTSWSPTKRHAAHSIGCRDTSEYGE